MIARKWMLFAITVPMLAQQPPGQTPATGSKDLILTAGKSVLVDSPNVIQRVAVANGDICEAVAVTPREVLVNGKAPGDTSLIVWEQGGSRLFFDVSVLSSESRLDAVRRELTAEKGDENVTLSMAADAIFVRGTVPDLTAASRAITIASTLGKPVNLLRVTIPGNDIQILLKVKFADVDRSALKQLGANLFSGNSKMTGGSTTGQFTPPAPPSAPGSGTNPFSLTNALNLFLFRPDLNLGATIEALQSNSIAEILAEPNVLAINGRTATFLAGGEFPYPVLQGAGSLGAVTIQFREYGVRLNFTPVITPRGTIHLTVAPEVSSLDYSNALVFNGYTIPAVTTRRMQTEIELSSGQSFAIAGLLNKNDTENLSKVPGLGDIPILGRFFRSRSITKSNSELLVMVTPEVVYPIPADAPRPELKMPGSFLPPNTSDKAPRTPGPDVTGVPPSTPRGTIPIEQLLPPPQTNQAQAPAAAAAPVTPAPPPNPLPVKQPQQQ